MAWSVSTMTRSLQNVPGKQEAFWTRVIWLANKHSATIESLIALLLQYTTARKRHNTSVKKVNPHCRGPEKLIQRNYAREIVTAIFPQRPATNNFKDDLAVACKTGNSAEIINTIRNALQIRGLGFNVVPSTRAIDRSTSKLLEKFTCICEPEICFSGFRCNLVKTVEFAAELLYNITNIDGLQVDIWGDGCEIGGANQTRLCFRILKDVTDKITSQSASIVFCFACESLDLSIFLVCFVCYKLMIFSVPR